MEVVLSMLWDSLCKNIGATRNSIKFSTDKGSKLSKIDNVTFFLSQYMLELGLLDSKMSQFPQSL